MTEFTLDVDYYKQDNIWVETQGLCKVVIYKSQRIYAYGDNLILFGSLRFPSKAANPGEFDYSAYLKQQKIYAVLKIDLDKDVVISQIKEKLLPLRLLKAKIFTLRKNINQHIHHYLPAKEATLLSAMMLGLRSELPFETKDIFVKTGTTHILAISGLHLAIIAYILFFVFGLLRIRYNLRAFFVIVIILCYAMLCGGRTPVVRAAIMITTFLLAYMLNREIDVYNILSLAGMLILLANPMQIFSAGFILSFVCVFSIIYLTPKIEKFCLQNKVGKLPMPRRKMKFFQQSLSLYLIKALSVSLAAYIGIAPVIACYFNIISPVTIIANLFIVPLTGLLICVGLTFIVFGLLFSFLAPIFGAATWLVAFLLEGLIFYLSKIPFAYFYIPNLPVLSVVGYYILIILAINRKIFRLSKGVICIIILGCINFCIWMSLLKGAPEQLKVTFLHVGHGDAAFIQFPNGRTMVVDTGAKTAHTDKGKDVVLPYIWHEGKRAIDCMVITHGDADHFGGAYSIIDKAKISFFLYNGRYEGEEGYARLMDLVKKSGSIKTIALKEGDRIEGFGDVQILVLHPSEEFVTDRSVSRNNSSIVLKLIYKNVSFLLCADILEKGIKNIMPYKKLLNSNIIKVPHHGSDTGRYTAEQFYNFVDPDIAIITASRNDPYGCPAESTVSLLSEQGATVYTTYETGAIIITTDGEDYNVTTTYNVERL